MARAPLILALANPEPEILPPLAKQVREDAIICTGRSDYPNQVNNVLCFPFIFRGALDVGATAINEEMKLAAVHAIAELAHAEQSEVVASAYGDQDLSFGPEYIIPKPFDPRLIVKIAPAVAKAAMDSGVATRPIADFDAYREAQRVCLQNQPVHEADFLPGAQRAEARGAGGRRRDARAARHPGAGIAGAGKTDSDRPSERD
jgi:malate dehydrogenase (oxaloacetate-decarboxylating)(NADP+)